MADFEVSILERPDSWLILFTIDDKAESLANFSTQIDAERAALLLREGIDAALAATNSY